MTGCLPLEVDDDDLPLSDMANWGARGGSPARVPAKRRESGFSRAAMKRSALSLSAAPPIGDSDHTTMFSLLTSALALATTEKTVEVHHERLAEVRAPPPKKFQAKTRANLQIVVCIDPCD